MNNIIAPETCASNYKWSKAGNVHMGVACASDLGFRVGVTPGYQLYNDSMDFGFRLYSPRTGKVMTFALEVAQDYYWGYSCAENDNLYLKIFND